MNTQQQHTHIPDTNVLIMIKHKNTTPTKQTHTQQHNKQHKHTNKTHIHAQTKQQQHTQTR